MPDLANEKNTTASAEFCRPRVARVLRGYGIQTRAGSGRNQFRPRPVAADRRDRQSAHERKRNGRFWRCRRANQNGAGPESLSREWQIGYDTPDANSPSAVPQIQFTHNGAIKYGHELAKIIFESVRLGLLSTNDLIHEIHSLEKIPENVLEENQPVQVELSTNATEGFQGTVQRLPQFNKVTAYGSVQIQLKQKQHAVGYQAMIYVCLPMNQVLAMDGSHRLSGRAKSKETVFYQFNRENAPFILDIVEAFGLASRSHNADIREILGKILAAVR